MAMVLGMVNDDGENSNVGIGGCQEVVVMMMFRKGSGNSGDGDSGDSDDLEGV